MKIEVQNLSQKNKNWLFKVNIIQDNSQTSHEVQMNLSDYKRLAKARSPEQLIKDAFIFLLTKEPKESILSHFNLTEIAKYFPEFESKI